MTETKSLVANTPALLLGKERKGEPYTSALARGIICDRAIRILAASPNARAMAVDPLWLHARILKTGGYQGRSELLMLTAVQLLVQHCQVSLRGWVLKPEESADGMAAIHEMSDSLMYAVEAPIELEPAS
jgi:hypothetical protein